MVYFNHLTNLIKKCFFKGDYGGSLYLRQNVSGKVKLVTVGILSYNEGCNIKHSPGYLLKN